MLTHQSKDYKNNVILTTQYLQGERRQNNVLFVMKAEKKKNKERIFSFDKLNVYSVLSTQTFFAVKFMGKEQQRSWSVLAADCHPTVFYTLHRYNNFPCN